MWKTVKLGEAMDIARGGSPRPIKSFITNATDGINWIKIGDTEQGAKYIQTTKEKIKREGIPRSRYVKEGDFLLSNSMSFGRPYILKIDGCIHDGWLVLSDYEKYFDADYLYYLLSSNIVKAQFESLARGSTVRNLNIELVSGVVVSFPPLAEQQRIVAKLDAAFAEIDRAVVALEQEIEQANSIVLSWLREQFKQRVHEDVAELSLATVNPDYGCKEGWAWYKLTDIAKLESGHTPSRRKPEYWGGDVKWVGIKDARIHQGKEIFDTEQKTNKLGLANSSARLLPRHTVCLSRTASVGYIFLLGEEMATSQDFLNWVCSSTVHPQFLQLLLLAEGKEISRFGSGAIHKTIYFDTAREFHVCIPDKETQVEIANSFKPFKDMSEELSATLATKRAALSALKSSILSQELQTHAA